MRQIADDVFQIPLAPRSTLNAYLLGDVLVDAGLPMHGKKLAKELAGRVSRHVLTHAHGDHAGGSKAFVMATGVPIACGEADAEAVRIGVPVTKLGAVGRVMAGFPAVGEPEILREGDTVGEFVVLETPGHSPGPLAVWRERDRVLIAGDVFFNTNFVTAGLRQPFGLFTVDPAVNRTSERKLVELEPDVVGLGHGPVVTGAAAKLHALAAKLPVG